MAGCIILPVSQALDYRLAVSWPKDTIALDKNYWVDDKTFVTCSSVMELAELWWKYDFT